MRAADRVQEPPLRPVLLQRGHPGAAQVRRAGGGGGGEGADGGGGAGGLITSYNNSSTTTNTLSFPSGKTAIATYMLNGNATDVSGTYSGTANSYVSYNTGKYGGAATFDGASSYINIPSGIYSAITGPFTLSAWVNTTSSGSYKIIIGKAREI